MRVLKSVSIELPANPSFSSDFFELLANTGHVSGSLLQVASTNSEFLPMLSIEFNETTQPRIVFRSTDDETAQIIDNQTGEERKSPHNYEHISLAEVQKRMWGANAIVAIDHLGVNFPWFDGLSPTITRLRQTFPTSCAYFRFPTGEDWDFIIPATENEFKNDDIDLSINRRPKLELVSFEKSSTPIIQVDCITTIDYEKLKQLFPESIIDEELRNIWVYLLNPYDLDICLVLNEPTDKDWSSFFAGHRLEK